VSNKTWEIHINTDHSIGASVVTSHSAKTWARITETAFGHWHHLVMTYDGKIINFYHNSHLKLTDSECCHGDIVSKNSDVVIGHSGIYNRYGIKDFTGYIDEMKLFKKALTAHEVLKLYRLKVV
jgi:hypothetical protein